MADGVQFLFELDAKAPGMDKLLTMLGQSNAKLKEGHGALKHETEEVKGLGGAFEKLIHSGLEPFLKKAEQIAEFEFIREGAEKLLEFPELLADKIRELGDELVDTAAKTESLNFSLDVNFGAGGKEISEWADKLAKQTPYTAAQIRSWAIELGHAGVAMKDLDKYMFAGLDVAARSADKVGAMQAAMEAMRRVEMQGKVNARTLINMGIPVEKLMATVPKLHGMTKIQANQALDQIEIGKEDLFRAITGGKPIGDVGADMQNLLSTKVKNLTSLPEQYFEKAADSAAFAPFKAKLDDIFKSFDPDSDKGKQIMASFAAMLMSIVDGLQKINFKEVADDFGKFVSAIEKMVPVIVQITGDIGATVQDAANKGGAAKRVLMNYTPFGLLQGGQQREDKAFDIMRREGSLMSDKGINKTLSSVIPGYGYVADTYLNPRFYQLRFGDATKGAVKGLDDGNGAIEAAGARAGAAAVDGAAGPKGIDAHSPSKKFEQLGMFANMGFVRGMRATAGTVADAIAGTFGVPTRRPGAAPSGGVTLSVHGTHIHVAHGGREEGAAAAEGFWASIEARLLAMLERKRSEEGS